jgi:hypothetical protein
LAFSNVSPGTTVMALPVRWIAVGERLAVMVNSRGLPGFAGSVPCWACAEDADASNETVVAKATTA